MATCTSAEKSAFLNHISSDVNNRSITVGTFNVNQYVNQWTVPVHTAIRECMKAGIGIVGLQEYCEFTSFYTSKPFTSTNKVSGGKCS
ncbi:hypothetical protein [Romboutsia sp.]|uniref:hypothetical protein n=1 Tax=Romboutsia sp. TaxID=1965302 RepID=UPI003F418843